MNKITTIALSALTLVATTAPQAMAKSNYRSHMTLGNVIRSTGINFKINPARCWDRNSFGWYWAAQNEMVICQENKRSVGVETQWTEEDLDTLRHEAQHLIQDCMDGSRQGALNSVYKNPVGFVKSTLSDHGIRSIQKAYSELGEHIIMMELEAFAVASLNQPIEQAQDISRYCL